MLVCINNKIKNWTYSGLTINKIYYIDQNIQDSIHLILENPSTYTLVNDDNILYTYDKSLFITIEEFRENKINELI